MRTGEFISLCNSFGEILDSRSKNRISINFAYDEEGRCSGFSVSLLNDSEQVALTTAKGSTKIFKDITTLHRLLSEIDVVEGVFFKG